MKKLFLLYLLMMSLLLRGHLCLAFEPTQPECLAPAKLGGGMDLTCRLVANSLLAANLIDIPMATNYKPGGIGAVAYNYVVGVRNRDPQLIVAASTGSVLNLATKKFGSYGVEDVRWLGALGTDYGSIAVKADAPWNSLADLISAIQTDQKLAIGGGGSIGSQDWMKIALLLQKANIDPKNIRYVAFEGGGEALEALLSGHIQAFSGDVSEVHSLLEQQQIKVLAVFSSTRLPGKFAAIPTATEQDFPIEWSTWRGYYMGPNVSDEAYNWWANSLRRLVKTEEFVAERERLGLYPLSLIGQEFDQYVRASVEEGRNFAREVGLLD